MKKKAVKHDQLCPFGGHGLDCFWGKVDLELLRLPLNVSRISKTKPT